MTSSQPSKGGFLKGRRAMLLGTTIFESRCGSLVCCPDAARHPAVAQNVTQQAQTVQRPIGFADIVEKVKPAVISVRVKMNVSPENSSFEGGQLPQGFGALLPPLRHAPEDMPGRSAGSWPA